MSLPFPPKPDAYLAGIAARTATTAPAGLPLPPRPPAAPYDPAGDEGYFSHVSHAGPDDALLRIGTIRMHLTRAQCNTLIGQLERVVGKL